MEALDLGGESEVGVDIIVSRPFSNRVFEAVNSRKQKREKCYCSAIVYSNRDVSKRLTQRALVVYCALTLDDSVVELARFRSQTTTAMKPDESLLVLSFHE